MSEAESKQIFQKKFNALLLERHVTQKEIASICGASTSTVSTWSKGLNMPRMDKIERLANHFGLPKSYFIEEAEKAPDLTEKDRRDVAKMVENIMNDMEKAGDLNFDGMPMSEEAKAAMASAMRIGLEEARRRNKETYTPKKYRKG